MINLKAVAAAIVISAGMASVAVDVSTGVANAAPPVAGPQYISQNGPGRGHGDGHGHGHDDDWWWRDRGGPRNWDPIDACIGVQGPFGYVQGSACI